MASTRTMGAAYPASRRAVSKVLRFAPTVAADTFRTLFTCGAGWGIYTQSMDEEHTVGPRITVLGGNLDGFALEAGGRRWP